MNYFHELLSFKLIYSNPDFSSFFTIPEISSKLISLYFPGWLNNSFSSDFPSPLSICKLELLSIVGYTASMILFIILSYYPLELKIFYDFNKHIYGLGINSLKF